MKTWLLRKLFFSKMMKNIRRGFWLEGYYEGKADEQFNRLLKGLDQK